MADDLPPGFKLDDPGDIPAGFKLDPPAPGGAPTVPISKPTSEEAAGYMRLHPELVDRRSENEKALTADRLRVLLQSSADRPSLAGMITGAGPEASYTERMTDWLVPSVKNVFGGVGSLVRGGEGTLGEKWAAGVNAEKEFRDINREKTSGVLGTLADAAGIAGSMGKAGPAGKMPGPMQTSTIEVTKPYTTTIPRAAAVGAGQGAISGAAENAQDWKSAAQGAAQGALAGGAAGGALQGLFGRWNALKAAENERQALRGPNYTVEHDKAKDLFAHLDESGLRFTQKQAKQLGKMLPQTLKDAKYTPTSAGELEDALSNIARAGKTKTYAAKPLNFTELQALREQMQAAGESNKLNPNLRRVAGRVTGMIDDFIDKNVPAINPKNVDLATEYPAARRAFRTGKLGEALSDTEYIAGLKADVAGGTSSAEKNTRRQLLADAKREIKDKSSNYSPVQEKARERAIRGGPLRRGLETIESYANWWPATAAAGGVAGKVLGIDPVYSALVGSSAAGGIGLAARHQANKYAQQDIDTLARAIMTDSTALPKQWAMQRDDLAKLMLNRKGARTAGGIAGNTLVDKVNRQRTEDYR